MGAAKGGGRGGEAVQGVTAGTALSVSTARGRGVTRLYEGSIDHICTGADAGIYAKGRATPHPQRTDLGVGGGNTWGIGTGDESFIA